MICYQKKKRCGNKDLEHCGYMKVIEIHDTSIVEPLTGIGVIELRLWKIHWVRSVWSRMG